MLFSYLIKSDISLTWTYVYSSPASHGDPRLTLREIRNSILRYLRLGALMLHMLKPGTLLYPEQK